MNPKRFFTGLGITIFFQLLLVWGIVRLFPFMHDHYAFLLISILSMALFCLLLYGAARIVVRGTQFKLYIQLIMIAVFFKLILCLGLILIYKKGFAPAEYSFIWPFLFIYITSTIFEVIFMDKTGRAKNTPVS